MVGEENKGLAAMFVMMNAARLGVGIQGLGQADIAFQNAVRYAQDRRQGRALTGPADPQEKADLLFVDPYAENRGTGAFIIIDESSNNTVGAGMIL